MLLDTPFCDWVSNKVSIQCFNVGSAGCAWRSAMQALVVSGNNSTKRFRSHQRVHSGLWPLTKEKLIFILVFPSEQVSSWNKMAPTTVPKSLKTSFFPALMLALNSGKPSHLHGKMLFCGPVVTKSWSPQDDVARENHMLQAWMHHVTYSSWKVAHTERCSLGQPIGHKSVMVLSIYTVWWMEINE